MLTMPSVISTPDTLDATAAPGAFLRLPRSLNDMCTNCFPRTLDYDDTRITPSSE